MRKQSIMIILIFYVYGSVQKVGATCVCQCPKIASTQGKLILSQAYTYGVKLLETLTDFYWGANLEARTAELTFDRSW